MNANLPRSFPVRLLTACLALLCTAAQLSPAPALAQGKTEGASFSELSKQGIHYYRKKLWGPAIATLEQAAATPQGQKDYKTNYYLAKSTEATLQLEKAFPYAHKALDNARNEEEKEDAKKLLETLQKYYAGVRFEQHPDQPEKFEEGGIIILKPTKPIINMQKKKVFEKIADYFRQKPVKLPITIYLPFGEYEANGAPFVIEEGKEAKAKVFLYNPKEGISWWWIVGGGVAAAGLTVGILLPVLLSEDTQQAKVGTITLSPATE
ncbi:MAG: hypothetical protein FJ125_16375 [Deltaproteobacteria bacterium]|nr:hypothetical protein [Deltaproteobacteria bacterium]